jgi:hypothetical protein
MNANGDITIDIADGTILAYISDAANNDEDSGIVSGGQHAGYWYDESSKISMEPRLIDEQHVVGSGGAALTISEKDLYPLTEFWLQTKGYTAKDMSNLKSGGRWGNPDIIGVSRTELMGVVEVDLASCEVKMQDKDWEEVIFEAISHKRFSNRSWFCYRVIDRDTPLPKNIEYYAERYRVGVVQIWLTDDELKELKLKSKEPLDFIERIIERVPALYDHVPLKEKRELIDRTGITVTLTF